MITGIAYGDGDHTLNTPSGALTFHVNEYRNDQGQKEISFELNEVRRFLPDTRALVLWGRDLDNDGKYDAWFYHGESGVVEAVDLPAADADGWDAAAKVLQRKVDLSNRWYSAILFGGITSSVSMTRIAQNATFAELARRQTDLREREIRANRTFAKNRLAPGLTAEYEKISDGWQELSEKVITPEISRNWKLGFADFGLYVAGGAVLRGASSVLGWAGEKLAGSSMAAVAERYYAGFAQGVARSAAEAAAKFRLNRIQVPGMVASTAASAGKIAGKAGASLQAMDSDGALARILRSGTRQAFSVAKSGVSEWRYIAATQTMQFIAELFNRRGTLYNPNPIILTKNIVSNKDLIQNMSYMTAETFLQTAVSSYSPNVAGRMLLCGVISAIDSNAMNLLVKGETDKDRLALDSAWEVILGNAQTNLDLTVKGRFKSAAEGLPRQHLSVLGEGAVALGENAVATPNPRLKLVGWAFVLLDQASGYVAYGMATQKLEESKQTLHLTPIYAPAAAGASADHRNCAQ